MTTTGSVRPRPPTRATSRADGHCAGREKSLESTRACRALFICEKFIVAHVLCPARDYEARSGSATRRMLASATDMAAALSFAYDIGEVCVSASIAA